MNQTQLAKFWNRIVREQEVIRQSESSLRFNPNVLHCASFKDERERKISQSNEREIRKRSSRMVSFLLGAKEELTQDQLYVLGSQVENFLLAVARRMDDLSVERLQVVGEAYRAEQVF